VRDVTLFQYPSCKDSIKPSPQFSCIFSDFDASEGSLFPDNYKLECKLFMLEGVDGSLQLPLPFMNRLKPILQHIFNFAVDFLEILFSPIL
jgi:hypothetical protein